MLLYSRAKKQLTVKAISQYQVLKSVGAKCDFRLFWSLVAAFEWQGTTYY